jgi:hypothetical protein
MFTFGPMAQATLVKDDFLKKYQVARALYYLRNTKPNQH